MHDLMPLIEILRGEEENGGGYLRANMAYVDEK